MRRIVFAVCTTITGLVLLFSWPTSLNRTVTPAASASGGTGGTTSGTTTSGTTTDDSTSGTTDGTTTDSGTAADSGTATKSGTTASSGTATTTTVDGAVASTRWGDVQVRITVSGGKVTAAEAVVYPNQNPRDQQINGYAIPVLNQEATAAGSASIKLVSGATVTSDGYTQSLQSALDQAGL